MAEVYGEETFEIKTNKGLWVSPPITSIAANPNFPADFPVGGKVPDDYCTTLINMIKGPDGNWTHRGSFYSVFEIQNALGDLYTTARDSTLDLHSGVKEFLTGDESKFIVDLAAYKSNLPTAINLAERKLYNYRPTDGVVAGTASYSTFQYTAFAQTYQPRTHLLYKDRIYAANSAGSWYRITGWGAFTALVPTALTETLLPGANNNGMSNLTGQFVFKDRLFCYRDNRVWYTDVATAGGYPETWDSTLNFFDLPSAGSPAIWNAFIINNLVYLFTEDGVYTLQVYGTPDNWVVRKLRDDIVIYHHYAACVNNGVIYFANYGGVFAFNGDQLVEIGQPLSYLFQNFSTFTGYGVSSFADGITLTIQKYQDGLPTFSKYVLSSSSVYYFDGEVWSEFQIGVETANAKPPAHGSKKIFSMVNALPVQSMLGYMPNNNQSGIPVNVLVGTGLSGSNYQQVVGYYEPAVSLSPSDQMPTFANVRAPIRTVLCTDFAIPSPGRFSNLKEIYLEILANTQNELQVEWVTTGDKYSVSGTAPFVVLSRCDAGYHFVRKVGPGFVQGMQLQVVNVPSDITGAFFRFPYFTLVSIKVSKNEERRITEQDQIG